MPKNFEPDSRFVDRLEWQLASEFRRKDRLKPAAGKVAVPRYVVALSLAAGVLLMGVAATKAADLIKDSWRKKIEVARLETEVKIKRAFLGFNKETAARAETQLSMGLIREDEYLASKWDADRAGSDLERSILDLEEAKTSGEAPHNELYAPIIGARDFVSERLEIEKKTLELDLGLRRTKIEKRLKQLVDLGVTVNEELEEFQASLASQEAGIRDIEKRLALRGQFLAGEISAGELEVQERMAVAETNRRHAQSMVDFLQQRLERLRTREAVGLITGAEVQLVKINLDAAKDDLNLAMQEIDILKKLK